MPNSGQVCRNGQSDIAISCACISSAGSNSTHLLLCTHRSLLWREAHLDYRAERSRTLACLQLDIVTDVSAVEYDVTPCVVMGSTADTNSPAVCGLWPALVSVVGHTIRHALADRVNSQSESRLEISLVTVFSSSLCLNDYQAWRLLPLIQLVHAILGCINCIEMCFFLQISLIFSVRNLSK
jgi:hypothetical protein